MAYGKILQGLLQHFFVTMGRAPGTPKEWAKLRAKAMELARKEEGIPSVTSKTTLEDLMTGPHISRGGPKGDRIWDFSKDLPTTDVLGKRGNIIPFPKGKRTTPAVKAMMAKGDIQVGKAPKTTEGILKAKKDRHILMRDAHEDILRIKRENKEAIDRFRRKMDENEPDKFQFGGIAPLVGEPSYSADFYDDRTPMKKGKKAKKKKLTAAEKEKEIIKEMIKKLPRHLWRMRPSGKQRYKKKSDLPEGILEILEKDPGFNFEDFAKIYWSPEGYQWTDEGFSRGRLGSYNEMTGDIELGLAPFGKKKYKQWELGKPHVDLKAFTDRDKATVALHELRHKNILENRELFEAQPEWVKSIEGPGYLPGGGTTGHELYDRFLDKRFNPKLSDAGPNDPYFDKILRDYWEPYAQEYENIAGRLKAEKRGEGIETLAAQGGRIGMAGGGALKKFIEKLFIKASNDIRQGKGKWKGLDLKQKIAQHDNLTKKVTEFQKTGNTEGLEIYFDVNPHEAFAAAQTKATRLGKRGPHWKEQEIQGQMDEIAGGVDERTMIKQKYPGITDDLVEKILIDQNPQRKAEVYSTIDQYMKLKEIGKSEAEAYDIITKSFDKKIPTKHAEGGRISNQSGGPVDHDALVQMYMAEGLSYEEAVQAAQSAANLPWDTLKKAEGGRIPFIYGGSSGLKAVWREILKAVNKGRPEKIDKLFPKLTPKEKKMFDWGKKIDPRAYEVWKKGDLGYRVEGVDRIINALKADKRLLQSIEKNRETGDSGLNFLMQQLQESMVPHVRYHKKGSAGIDQDILDLETIKKNMLMKDRKLNAQGGRISYSGGGQAGLPAITYGMSQPEMQGPQMPAMGPQPAGIPGGTIVAQNQMQQTPWMQNSMMGQQPPMGQQPMGQRPPMGQQPMGQRPPMGQQPMGQQPMGQRPPMGQQPMGQQPPMGAQSRMPFGLGGMSRRAFMKMMAGAAALPFIGRGAKQAGPEVAKVTEEIIKRGPDGMPTYIYDLIEVVKAKGTRDIIEGYKRSDYSTVHSYKGVDVVEHPNGATTIKKAQEKPLYGSDEPSYHEIEMEIRPGEDIVKQGGKGDDAGKVIQSPDEYFEATVKPDRDGKLKDVDEYIDEIDHLELKQIAEEDIGWKEGFKPSKQGKASGGLAYALGE